MMEVDETQLTEFFGMLPRKEDPEEKEFFGTSTFAGSYDDFDLEVSFSSQHEDMLLSLVAGKTRRQVLDIHIRGIAELRIRDHPKRLLVLTGPGDAKGGDPALYEKMSITVDPFQITVNG